MLGKLSQRAEVVGGRVVMAVDDRKLEGEARKAELNSRTDPGGGRKSGDGC